MKSFSLRASLLGKAYPVWASNLKRFASWFFPNIEPESRFWALRGITVDVRKGEAVAFVGQNGAGKSTLLKMITGTVRPSEGSVSVNGRINAILELGLGFNPELTGRQNVFHAGGLMGYSRRELMSLMLDIENFAEIGEFFDRPLRVYSSGMQARLAFSLATAVRPDVLIVDEVLAVGDSYFQHKSFDRIRQFKQQGTSILLVTHNLNDVRALCDRVVLLDHGCILKDGTPDEVLDYFNALLAAQSKASDVIEQERQEDGWLQTRSGTLDAVIVDVTLMSSKTEQRVKVVRVGEDLVFNVRAKINRDLDQLILGVMIRNREGQIMWGSNTHHTNQVIKNLHLGENIEFNMRFCPTLGPGSYALTVSLTGGVTHVESNYEWRDNALVFEVVNEEYPFFIGSVWINSEFDVKRTSWLIESQRGSD